MNDAFGQIITEATVTFVDSYQLPGGTIGQTPRHFDFNSDGTKMLVVEGASDFIYEFDLSTGYDLTTLSYSGDSERLDDVRDGQPRSMEFNSDGTKMFLIGNAADEINQYLLTDFDISGASFDKRVDITDEVGTDPNGMEFTADGTKVLLNNKKKKVIEFEIDAFDIAKVEGQTGTSINLAAHLTKGMRGMTFADDGKKFFVTTSDGINRSADNKVHEFSLSTPYEVSTYTYVDKFDVNEWETDPQDVRFNPSGTRMYVLGPMNDGTTGEFINEFALSCPWQLTGECSEEVEHKPQGGPCGRYSDCIRPSITTHGVSETPDGFSINGSIFEENQERYNKNPIIQGTVGEPVTIKVRAWENMGTDRISLAIAYLAMHEEKPHWKDSTANIEFRIQQDEFKVYDKNKIFSAVGVETEKVTDPYGDNLALEVLDITFTIIFAKPMEPSHIGIQTIDLITNYELIYFENALEVLPREIVQVEEVPEEIPEKVPESLPEVIPEEIPEEFVPEPEPPVKEPEPEVMLTTINEKTVLEFVDENMPAKHYVKRYITETEYREWFDVNYSDYKFWEGIGITQERFDQIVLEIQSEPKPKMIQTGFVLVPDDQKSLPLVEEMFEPEPVELEPVKEEKKGFFDWLFSLFG